MNLLTRSTIRMKKASVERQLDTTKWFNIG